MSLKKIIKESIKLVSDNPAKIDKEFLFDCLKDGKNMSDYLKFARQLLKYYNIPATDAALGFFIELHKLNENLDFENSTGDDLIIPELKKYKVKFEVPVRHYSTEYWEIDTFGYSTSDIENRVGSDINYWDGKMVDKYTDEGESDEYEATDIIEID